jgi:hypothetical protein
MTDLKSRAAKTILIIAVVVLSVAYVNERKSTVVKFVPVQGDIPSQREIQQRLTDLDNSRYDPNGVDGWIGTESRTAWDNYTCDQFAKRDFEGMIK